MSLRVFTSRKWLRDPTWDGMLAHDRVVLGCYEVDPRECHRTLLAEILVTLGAVYGGEIAMPTRAGRSA